MVDTARQLLDELMGRNRNLDPTTAKTKKIQWDDPEFCLYYLVKFCPHDLFVNTRADLGQCTKLHDDEAKRLFDEARSSARKRSYEDEFLRFSNHMINEVDRKIEKGRQRLQLMNKTPDGRKSPPLPPHVTKYQEMLNNMNARIKKLISEAEEAGNRGDVEQAQGLMTLCDQVKEEKETLIKNHENGEDDKNAKAAWTEYTSNEKQMEVCEVCGAFLIVGDAQQRIEDHLSGKQHLGYSKLRKAVEEMYAKRQKEREKEEKDRRYRRRDDFNDDRRRDRGDRNDRDRRDRDRNRERDGRQNQNNRDRHRGKYDDRRRRGSEERRDRDRERDRRHRSRSRSSSRH